MHSPDLLTICISAFAAVFSLLAVLALIMRLITFVFVDKESGADAALIAAVTSTMSTLYPGARISNIEEIK